MENNHAEKDTKLRSYTNGFVATASHYFTAEMDKFDKASRAKPCGVKAQRKSTTKTRPDEAEPVPHAPTTLEQEEEGQVASNDTEVSKADIPQLTATKRRRTGESQRSFKPTAQPTI